MSITRGNWDLHKGGSKDAARHREKLKDAFKQKLHDIISEENIITSENGKTVKVPIKALDSYRFIYDRHKMKHVAQGTDDTKVGDRFNETQDQTSGKGQGQAGDEEGEEYYEAEIDLEDLVEMMLEDLSLPRLDPKKKADITVPDVRYDDVRKKGMLSNLDKRRTLMNNLRRNAARGSSQVGDFANDDLRFRTWSEHKRPITSAVVIAMIDVSASMSQEKKYIARSFFFWMVNFLRKKYQSVDIVFISHTTSARVCTEEEFFYKGESGGTMVSSAYRLALEAIETQYDPNLWNIFAFHFSDGETFGDEEECVQLIRELAKVCNMVGYSEINQSIGNEDVGWGFHTLFDVFASNLSDVTSFVQNRIQDKSDVWPTLRRFFSEELEDD